MSGANLEESPFPRVSQFSSCLFRGSHMSRKKALLRCSEVAIAAVLSLTCRCRSERSCLAGLTIQEVRTCREYYWSVLETERQRLSWLQSVRKKVLRLATRCCSPHFTFQRTSSTWDINGKLICTEAWLKLYGISFGKFAKARQDDTAGEERPRKTHCPTTKDTSQLSFEKSRNMEQPFDRRKSSVPRRWQPFPDMRMRALS